MGDYLAEIITSKGKAVVNSIQGYLKILKITQEAPGVKTFRLEFLNSRESELFSFKTGQFEEYSVYGEGESTFYIASPHTRKGYIECTFRQVGRVTTALANQEEGAVIGFRGPYGNVLFVKTGLCLRQNNWQVCLVNIKIKYRV